MAGNPHRVEGDRISAPDLDEQLHSDRLIGRRGKRTFLAPVGELPDGTMVVRPGKGGVISAALIIDGGLHEWSPFGYGEREDLEPRTRLEVLTPASTVRALDEFRPDCPS